MKIRFVVVSLFAFVSLLSAFVGNVAATDTVCIHLTSSGTNSTAVGTLHADIRAVKNLTTDLLFEQTYLIPAGGHNSIDAYFHVASGTVVSFDNRGTYDPDGYSPQSWTFTSDAFVVDDANCGGFGKITDGRINELDLAAPLAAYCANGGIAVWDIDDSGHGTLGFTSTSAEISKALSDAASSGQNVLVGQGLGNSLYAITNGQLMLVGPDVKEPSKTYQFLAAGDVCG